MPDRCYYRGRSGGQGVWELPRGFPGGSDGQESACNAGDIRDVVSIPGLGRSLGEENGYPLQYSGLENSMDCTVCGVTKSRTRLSNFHFHSVNRVLMRTITKVCRAAFGSHPLCCFPQKHTLSLLLSFTVTWRSCRIQQCILGMKIFCMSYTCL